jgi:hypothetical protein
MFAMALNEPVKQRSSTGADTLVGNLHDPTEYLANGGFPVSSGHLEIERQTLGITQAFYQFLREVLFACLGGEVVGVRHGAQTVSNRCEVTCGLLESITLESIIKKYIFESKNVVGSCTRRDPSLQGSGAISGSLKALGATDQIVSQVPEQKLDRHLEKMAEEERITEIRKLRAVLPATELGGGFVSEEGRELLARHPALHARDPETVLNCGNTHTHRTQRRSTVGALYSAYSGVP